MRQACIPFKEIPSKLKAAIAFFGLHLLFYSITLSMIFLADGELHPMWIAHILIVAFLASEVKRPRASLFYMIPGYCAFMALKSLMESSSVLALLTYIPLLLVVPCILKEKNFYFPEPKTQN